ncbi:MAG: DUF1698 domain-containing protein [Armatimonadetes bacterium]|nr:DUF1698 domain-containing protein [Armatimonadota bacterium]
MASLLSAVPPGELDVATLAEMHRIRWWHRIPVGVDSDGRTVYTPGEVRHGPDGGDWPTTRFGLPTDLSGKTVLDIGAWDGFFSFEAERRGASRVLAVDVSQERGGNWGGTRGFNFAHRLLASRVEFQPISIYDLTPETLGQFDLVFCFGVLYHVKDPLRAIEAMASVTRHVALTETAAWENVRDQRQPLWAFRPGFDGDPTNYWYPTCAGMEAAARFAGLDASRLVHDSGSRFTLASARSEDSLTLAYGTDVPSAAPFRPRDPNAIGHRIARRLLGGRGVAKSD